MHLDPGFPQVTLRLVGELDMASRPHLRASTAGIRDALSANTYLVIDLAALTFCDAAGVGDLVTLIELAREQCRGAVVSDPPQVVTMIAAALRLDLPVDVAATRATTPEV